MIRRRRFAPSAFTLIELLIVVAIIAILAAIAVPNFLEAQVRAKASRAYSDMRTLKTALESYKVDTNKYPPDWFGQGMYKTWSHLTTPVAYITSIPRAAFEFNDYEQAGYNNFGIPVYDYALWDVPPSHPQYSTLSQYRDYAAYVIVCAGPDRDIDMGRATGSWYGDCKAIDQRTNRNGIYSATNGTISSGDIVATNKEIYN